MLTVGTGESDTHVSCQQGEMRMQPVVGDKHIAPDVRVYLNGRKWIGTGPPVNR